MSEENIEQQDQSVEDFFGAENNADVYNDGTPTGDPQENTKDVIMSPEKQEEIETAKSKQEPEKQEINKEETSRGFDSKFLSTNEDGETSINNEALNSLTSAKLPSVETAIPKVEAPIIATDPEKTALTGIEKIMQDEDNYKAEKSKLPLDMIAYARDNLSKGIDIETVLNGLEVEVNKVLREDFDTWNKGQRTERYSNEEKERLEASELKALAPKAESNMVALRTSLGLNSDDFNELIYDPKFGGKHIEALYNQQNPTLNLQGTEYTEDLRRFFTKFTSNQANTNYLGKLALMEIKAHYSKDISNQTRRNAVSQKGETKGKRIINPKAIVSKPQNGDSLNSSDHAYLDSLVPA